MGLQCNLPSVQCTGGRDREFDDGRTRETSTKNGVSFCTLRIRSQVFHQASDITVSLDQRGVRVRCEKEESFVWRATLEKSPPSSKHSARSTQCPPSRSFSPTEVGAQKRADACALLRSSLFFMRRACAFKERSLVVVQQVTNTQGVDSSGREDGRNSSGRRRCSDVSGSGDGVEYLSPPTAESAKSQRSPASEKQIVSS